MIIVGDELIKLINNTNIAPLKSYDNTCLKVSLGKTIIKMIPSSEKEDVLRYGESIPKEFLNQYDISKEGLMLKPNESVLAMSNEEVKIPNGYMGILQTKGSLARLMVSLHFSDGQIDSGFKGHITYEIFNASKFKVYIPFEAYVGNLYIFKTCGKVEDYNGKYCNSNIPTVQK